MDQFSNSQYDEWQDYCPECGRMIDNKMERGGDDIIAAPYVTASGDYMCWYCGIEWDRREEEQDEWADE